MNTAGLVTPATVAVAVKVPAVVFASNRGEVATPDASVVSVACVLPPGKLAPALPAPDPDAPAPPPAAATRAEAEGDAHALEGRTGRVGQLHLERAAVPGADGRRQLALPDGIEQGWLAGQIVELEARRLR